MKYLAFDIEAANGYKPYSICSIGVVIADSDFCIESRRNIWINPKTKYDLDGTRKNVGINLHLDLDVINNSPVFGEVYGEIKALLENPEYLVMGHAVESDVYMLNAACKHNNLPSINFRFICSQLLYKLYKGDKEVRALNKIADELSIEFEHHASDEDALMSLLTTKFICSQTGLSALGLVEEYGIRIGENRDFELLRTVPLSELNKKKKKKHRSTAKANTVKREG